MRPLGVRPASRGSDGCRQAVTPLASLTESPACSRSSQLAVSQEGAKCAGKYAHAPPSPVWKHRAASIASND